MRQVELAQRNLDLHARIGIVAKHFGNPPDRLRVLRGLRDDFDRGHLAGLGLARVGGRNQDVLHDAPVLRHEEQHAVLLVQAADDAPVGALEHFDDGAGRPAARILARHAHRGAIAMHHLAHFGRRQEHMRAGVIRDQEAVPVAMPFDAPRDHRDAPGGKKTAGAVLHHLPGAFQLGQGTLEIGTLAAADAQAGHQLGRPHRRAGALQRGDDFPAVGLRGGGTLAVGFVLFLL